MTTIEEILGELGIPFRRAGEHHHVANGWVGVLCSRCGDSDKFRFGINVNNWFAGSCWQCGKISVAEVLAETSGKPLKFIRALLGDGGKGDYTPKDEKPVGTLVIPAGVGPLLKPHRDYLKRRGFDPDALAAHWGVGGIGVDSRLAWRIFVPVSKRGKTVSWTTRAISDENTKRYVNARSEEEAVPAKSVLFGADKAGHAAIITEGPFDAMRIGPGGVATMGLVCTSAQISAMAKFPVRIVCFDSETQAQRRAAELCDSLSGMPGRTVRIELETGKDAGAASEKELRQLRRVFLK